MQNQDSLAEAKKNISGAEVEPENEVLEEPERFPFLTRFWKYGYPISTIIAAIVGIGMIVVLSNRATMSSTILIVGALYGLIIFVALKFYSELVGTWLHIEENTRITADVLLRKEAKEEELSAQ